MEKLENSTDCKETVSPLNNSGSVLNSTVSRHEAMGFVLVHAGEFGSLWEFRLRFKTHIQDTNLDVTCAMSNCEDSLKGIGP